MLVLFESVLKKAIYFVTLPLRVLYFHGPRLGGYGFQEGVRIEHACEQVTSVRSEFWVGSNDAIGECADILERKFIAFMVGGCALLVIGGIFQYVHILSTRHAISPTVNKLDDMLRYLKENKTEHKLKSLT